MQLSPAAWVLRVKRIAPQVNGMDCSTGRRIRLHSVATGWVDFKPAALTPQYAVTCGQQMARAIAEAVR